MVKHYTEELKKLVVERVLIGNQQQKSVAEEFDISVKNVFRWVNDPRYAPSRTVFDDLREGNYLEDQLFLEELLMDRNPPQPPRAPGSPLRRLLETDRPQFRPHMDPLSDCGFAELLNCALPPTPSLPPNPPPPPPLPSQQLQFDPLSQDQFNALAPETLDLIFDYFDFVDRDHLQVPLPVPQENAAIPPPPPPVRRPAPSSSPPQRQQHAALQLLEDFRGAPKVDIGLMNKICRFCKARTFKNESVGFCCNKGKVNLPEPNEIPETLRRLLSMSSIRISPFLYNLI